MLVFTGVAFLFLSQLPAQAAGQLVYAAATCSSGFEWLSTSKGQSPCDAAVQLGAICAAGRFNISQLTTGNVYLGPPSQDECRCSSVYYSVLSACAYCQQHNYLRWSVYNTNCSTTSVATFPYPFPLNFTVHTWAYQNVSIMDLFDINPANATDKPEGPPSSTTGGATSSSPSPSGLTSGTSSNTKIAVIAASVGGLVCLAVIGGIVAFCLIRRRRRSSKAATKLEPISTHFNRTPEVSRPTIPGFSPYVHTTPLFHVPDTANTSPRSAYPMSMVGASDFHETSPVLFSNVGERYYDSQDSSPIPVTNDRYYEQASLSTLPITSDNHWAQTSSASIAHYSPALSALPIHQTGDSTRYNDRRSVVATTTTHRQSLQPSVVSSQTNQGTVLTSTSRVDLLPPAYADIVDGASRRPPLPEKQGISSEVTFTVARNDI